MFEPIKSYNYISFTIINCEINETFRLLKKRLIDDYKGESEWSFSSRPLNISEIMKTGQTTSGLINRRFIIWEPESKKDITVFLSNSSDGCDTIINASLPDSIDIIKLYVSKTKEESFNKIEFRKETLTRLVMAYWDSDKWVFYEKGEPMDFENKEYYKGRLKKNRLNYEIIKEYLEANGYDLNSPDFWWSKRDAICFFEKHANKTDG